ncbi:hypothetical protein HYW82_00650 [Candidatus Peregrinibacteria bacterium]|nr:hypothetical protein [Candidatus Peregrinibacteria bacterium]
MTTNVTGVECGCSSMIVEIPYSEKAVISIGDEVIFKDAEEKEEYGVVKYINRESADKDKIVFTGKILRRATPNDIQRVESHIDAARMAMEQCKELVSAHKLNMTIFRVGYSFDGSKVYFLFISEDRVDFRNLVKDLAKTVKKQIQLRQIGPRDKARLIGGFGKCGRPLCCSTWLGKFESINMEMVREQALEAKGSSKLSGACGKLLCCLRYEVDAYKDLRKGLPKIGDVVRLKKPAGEATVIALDILNQKMKVILGEGGSIIVEAKEIEKAVNK